MIFLSEFLVLKFYILGRFKKDDKNRFYHIAFGSVRECQSLLIVEQLENTEAFKTLDSLAGSLYANRDLVFRFCKICFRLAYCRAQLT